MVSMCPPSFDGKDYFFRAAHYLKKILIPSLPMNCKGDKRAVSRRDVLLKTCHDQVILGIFVA